jgi:predicted transcriptional regulator
MADDVKALAARLVAAYLRNNALPAGDVPGLIQATYSAMVDISAPEAPACAERPQPAVPVKKSVMPESIICLECGKHQKTLKRHIGTAHGLSVDEYRAKWSLPADYPMVAPDYAQHRSQLAFKIGLGRKKSPGAAATSDATEPMEAKPVEKPRHHYPAARWSKPSA